MIKKTNISKNSTKIKTLKNLKMNFLKQFVINAKDLDIHIGNVKFKIIIRNMNRKITMDMYLDLMKLIKNYGQKINQITIIIID